MSESIQNIADSTTSIHETLIKQQDLDKAREDDTAIDDEQDKRDDKEQKGEGIGAGIQKIGQKMLAPVQSAFEKYFCLVRPHANGMALLITSVVITRPFVGPLSRSFAPRA